MTNFIENPQNDCRADPTISVELSLFFFMSSRYMWGQNSRYFWGCLPYWIHETRQNNSLTTTFTVYTTHFMNQVSSHSIPHSQREHQRLRVYIKQTMFYFASLVGCDTNFSHRRYNTADQCLGAGIRLGGHVIDGFVYGVDNDVSREVPVTLDFVECGPFFISFPECTDTSILEYKSSSVANQVFSSLFTSLFIFLSSPG